MKNGTKFIRILILQILLAIIHLQNIKFVQSQLLETDRIKEYNDRGYEWPPPVKDYVPPNQGWHDLITRRLKQVDQMNEPDMNKKYNSYINALYSGVASPHFSEYGWGLTRAPQDLVDELRLNLHKGLVNNKKHKLESGIRAIESINAEEALNPIWIDQPELNQKALHTLKPILESWTGAQLVPNNAYGLRIYRNESILNMHLDNAYTHIVSCIFHIDHDPMSEPWPLIIEDFDGNTVEVTLESGDLLLYESSKCFHGRPKPFNGAWYSSLFLHYFPIGWNGSDHVLNAQFRLKPRWRDLIIPDDESEKLPPLLELDTSFKEPTCDYSWCALKNTTKYSGPAKEGVVMSANGHEMVLEPLEYNNEL